MRYSHVFLFTYKTATDYFAVATNKNTDKKLRKNYPNNMYNQCIQCNAIKLNFIDYLLYQP